VLDQVTDVRNFGAICRSASCFGVDAVVIPSKGSAEINEFAIKSSAGAIFHLAICRVKSLSATLDFLKDSGFAITACSEKGNTLAHNATYDGPRVLIMGSEEKGISSGILVKSDDIVRIPMQGPIESLNVSVACGILLSEAYKQRMDD
jgi:23S rRNA (guanosine2251-2'-O)-methyltransferase